MDSIKMFCKKMYDFFTTDKRSAIIWLLIRVYVGYEWLIAGWDKLVGTGWAGLDAGGPIKGFLMGAAAKAYTAGMHHDVSMWYAWFINHVAIPNACLFANIVTYGEILVGLGLILGLFTTAAATFGAFMNFNYLFAGTVSTNPWLLLLQIFILCGRKVAGWIGLDRYRKQI
jgi:thiosulfate dehydrogenase (quinone) large subunit